MKAMRTIVMFDMPTASKSEKKSYMEFRRYLLSQGYRMEQFSVYSKLSLSASGAQAEIRRLEQNLPFAGRVTAFTMTDKEYARRRVLLDTENRRRKTRSLDAQLTLEL